MRDQQTLNDSMPTLPKDDVSPAVMTPEREAHLRNLNQVKKNFADVLTGKYLSRTHGDQVRD